MSALIHKDTVEAKLHGQRLAEELLGGDLSLPLLPEAAVRVIEACRTSNCDARQVAEIVQRDPSLASNVLRIANSALYSPTEPIVSLSQAVSRLGLAALSSIAVSVVVRGELFVAPRRERQLRELWHHSAVVAAWARAIARSRRRNVEGALLAGLLHDTGRAVVSTAIAGLEELAACRFAPDLEADWSDQHHAEVGARLVESWRLPNWACAAALFHHDPLAAEAHVEEVATVYVADQLAHWSLAGDEARVEALRNDPVLSRLSLYSDELEPLLAAREEVEQVAEVYL